MLFIAVTAVAAVLLGVATGARAATNPGGVGTSSGTGTSSGSGTSSGTGTSSSGNATSSSGTDTSSGTGTTGPRTLRLGMSGNDVRTLQTELRTLGYRVIADGAYGTKTVRNVRRYERKSGIAVDGAVDPAEAQQIAQAGGAGGRAGATPPAQPAAGPTAALNPDGTATAPAGAPAAIQQIIQAGNQIASAPYVYGGGHNDGFLDSGYDCSGSVSYALHGAGLLSAPLDSSDFMSWGDAGPGQWVTLYTNPDHIYMIVAGLRFDTSGARPSRWQTAPASTSGYVVRHPTGL